MIKKIINKTKQFIQIPNNIVHILVTLKERQNIDFSLNRKTISSEFIKGHGIEIGALHNPLIVPKGYFVKYLDRMKVDQLRAEYPELNNLNLVNVDIIDNGEKLLTIENDSQDFIIANHMLEHCKNPIQTIENFLSKLKSGGIIYLAIPDMKYSFDKGRSLTSFSHILEDYKNPSVERDFEHVLDWTKNVDNVTDENEIKNKTKITFEREYSIHYHVWNNQSFFDFLNRTREVLGSIFEVIFYYSDFKEEIISILKKH